MPDTEKNPMSQLDPREKLDCSRLIEELKNALIRTGKCDYFKRMQRNMEARYCIWPDQHEDGRKWKKERRLKPGENEEIFPWVGASDCRVRKIDEIAKERVGFMKAAYDRTDSRISPRDMMPNEDLMQKSAIWTMVSNFYLESSKRELRRENARWCDIAETYGHSLLYVDWQETKQLDKRSITQDQMLVLVSEAAVQVVRALRGKAYVDAGTEVPADLVSPAEDQQLREAAMRKLNDMIEDPDQLKTLAEQVRAFDPLMTVAESRRVAKGLNRKGEAVYHIPVIRDSGPVAQALTPMLDVIYPPETTNVKEAPWIAMPEWVLDTTLRERVETMGYDSGVVEAVIDRGPGTSFETESLLGHDLDWVASRGVVGRRIAKKEDRARSWQIMHIYYRATSATGIPALYHTVAFGGLPEKELMHEACEHAHGNYPFIERMAQIERATLIECEGIGEISYTDQQEIKVQRDMRVDNASVQMQPPALVPMNHSGGRLDYRPRAQIPVRLTAGGGKPEFLQLRVDATQSKEVENTTKQSLDELWFRGPTVDEAVKQTMRQVMVNDFLSDLEAARRMMWRLIQERATDKVRAGVVDGVAVNAEVSRDDIQGGVSMQMHFDVTDLDYKLVETKAKLLREVVAPLDRSGNMPTDEICRVLLASFAPGWARVLTRPSALVREEEVGDEKKALGDILNGLEPPYIPGKNHELRLQILQQALTTPNPDGSPSRVQRILAENPDVMALLENRMKFHEVQKQQTKDNPAIGRLGVEPLQSQTT